MDKSAAAPQVSFETHPSRYRHWTLAVDGEIARLTMKVQPFGGQDGEVELGGAGSAGDGPEPQAKAYELKSNSYDLSVDIELADAVQRLRFTHPSVKTVVITSGHDRIFRAGANIYMLASATHPFKVNFCKYTNETRLYLEEASAQSGLKSLAACNGATAGGGYELAVACDEIVLIDDGASTVALPEVPLLGVLPGTGGLTRLVDKRKVRRDLADAFSTLAEGVKGKRAVEWGLVDAVVPRSKFADTIAQRARGLAAKAPDVPRAKPVKLDPIGEYRHVSLKLDEKSRIAELTVRGPAEARRVDDASFWPLRMARELDHALLRLRFEHENVGLVLVRTEGDRKVAHEIGEMLTSDDGFIREVRLNLARTLRRMDVTARSFFAVVDQRSCFSGPLFELLLACDRTSVLDADGVAVWPDALTGMEQNYRFAGPETLATKIFGRLSAWQNWIFIRPNATGERGALTMYGKPERPQFDYRRT